MHGEDGHAGDRNQREGSIIGLGLLSVCGGGVGCRRLGGWLRMGGQGGVNSLTISEVECSTFLGLSAPLLMCEEITLSRATKPRENHLL